MLEGVKNNDEYSIEKQNKILEIQQEIDIEVRKKWQEYE